MLCPECGEVVAPGPMRVKEAIEDAAPVADTSNGNAAKTRAAEGIAKVRALAEHAFGRARAASLKGDAAASMNG